MGVGWTQGWANEMIDLLVEAKDAVEAARAAGSDRLDAATLHSIRVRYGLLINGVGREPRARGRQTQRGTRTEA